MAHMHVDFWSDALGLCTSMNVILPQATGQRRYKRQGPLPVLYLLHGLSDHESSWTRWTAIERYVESRYLAVVMPTVHRGFYTDMEQGGRYWTFVSEELPRICAQFFPLSPKPEDTFVAGLSMGGYGALKLALRCPGKFAAAGAFSAAIVGGNAGYAFLEKIQADDAFRAELSRIFGASVKPEDDLYKLASDYPQSMKKPLLFQCCGTADFLYEDNVRFHAHLENSGFPVTYTEEPNTQHTWDYWDREVEKFLRRIPLREV